MSDNESDYYSDSIESDEESLNVSNKKPVVPIINAAKKFGNYIEDESEVDDSEPDDADIEEEEEEEEEEIDEQVGGVEDYLSQDEDDEPKVKEEEEPDDAESEENEDDDDIEIDEEGVALEKKPKPIKQKKTTQLIIADDDEDEDEYEENYLQKFDNEINRNYIVEFHPECLNHNSDEVAKLSRVIRDENNIIIDPLHKTLPYLTKYEKARILGQRAKQIETGSKPFVKIPENIIDSYVISELELREKKIPFIIKRPIPGGAFEYWNLRDLEIINF
jgi:DNA-directed RNA polymerase I, II, and III subunit RPABC2